MKDVWTSSKDKQYLGVETSANSTTESAELPSEAEANAALAAVEAESTAGATETVANAEVSLEEAGTQV